MNVSKLPLNQKTTIIAEKFMIAVANRISEKEVIISYTDLTNHKEVLKILQDVKSGYQVIQMADTDYWDIYADGNYLTNYKPDDFKNLEVKVKVTTRDKTLEILSFKNEISSNPKKRTKKIAVNGNNVIRQKKTAS